MFSITFRSFAFPRKLCAAKNNLSPQRKFSIISVHTSFPATLYRFQPQRSSGLFDYQQDGADYEDALKVSNDGLIYPRVSHDHPYSNGAVLMPNTFLLQEWVRTSYDNYLEDCEDGQSPSNTLVLRIAKGTPIPNALTLLYESLARFSLQPSRPMTIKDLNDLLSGFYYQNASFINAVEWMNQNQYHKSILDEAVVEWMGH